MNILFLISFISFLQPDSKSLWMKEASIIKSIMEENAPTYYITNHLYNYEGQPVRQKHIATIDESKKTMTVDIYLTDSVPQNGEILFTLIYKVKMPLNNISSSFSIDSSFTNEGNRNVYLHFSTKNNKKHIKVWDYYTDESLVKLYVSKRKLKEYRILFDKNIANEYNLTELKRCFEKLTIYIK